VPKNRLRVGIVGCGDVAHRHYLEPLTALAARAEIVGCCDPRLAAAEGVVAAVRDSSPRATAFDRLDEMLREVAPDAVFNLTPAPLHAEVTAACLAAGAHVYSEKPIASSIAEADRLIARAHEAGLLLLCATASALTAQVRWLRSIIDSGRLGRPTLAVAQVVGMGPADWLEYTGDPAVFYGPGVGPVRDLGVYRLHELTALLGPVRRVGAMGSIAIPERTIVAGPKAGQTVTVTAPDHVLIHLEFAGGALGQLLASFAVPASQAPRLELHLTGGSISLVGDQFDAIPASVFLRAGATAGVTASDAEGATLAGSLPAEPGWHHGVPTPPPPDRFPTVSLGVGHFLACVAGDERPVLTAEHARHVLEIMLLAHESMADGCVKDLTTTF
jgi:predicted dehydrogenase